MDATFWALLPPIIAIILALLTKEVYISLMVGILSGALLFNNFNLIETLDTTFSIMGDKIGSNVEILIFLVLLGIIVALITKSGASASYGNWASTHIKSKRGALAATSFLGILIFVDDYFNCLTVGTVMKPVTDKYKISPAKLAYIIDATAAPICIISPISSWAAAVGSSLPNGSTIDGFSLFIKTIPFNFYAIFTLIFITFMIWNNRDYSKMRTYEELYISPVENNDKDKIIGKGKVIDLILPIFILIISCVCTMLYTGGYFTNYNITDAFASCNSGKSLVLGAFITLIFILFMYVPRKIIKFSDFCESFTEGFKAMTPAIMILCLAWTLSGICSSDYLNIGGYVSSMVSHSNIVGMFLPFAFFVIALFLAFSTGTSWGTFGILIPIAIAIFSSDATMIVICVSAILSGAVCGDHVSPISDTTILASTGASCKHLDHVSTQLPYSLTVAIPCIVGYLTAGISGNGWIGLVFGLVSLICTLVIIYLYTRKLDITC